jgi:hypothetical protein
MQCMKISCQKCNSRLINSDCIYRKIRKKTKRQTLKMNLPFLKNDITKNTEALIFTFSLQIGEDKAIVQNVSGNRN